MKRLSWIISIVFFLGLIAEGFYFNQAQKENAMLASPEHLQMQLLPTLNEMANNPNQQVEFTATIATIGPLIVEQAKKDPKRFSQFSTEIVRTAIKSDIGLALLFQDYANTQTKLEMERIRKEYNADKFVAQEKQLAELKKTNESLLQQIRIATKTPVSPIQTADNKPATEEIFKSNIDSWLNHPEDKRLTEMAEIVLLPEYERVTRYLVDTYFTSHDPSVISHISEKIYEIAGDKATPIMLQYADEQMHDVGIATYAKNWCLKYRPNKVAERIMTPALTPLPVSPSISTFVPTPDPRSLIRTGSDKSSTQNSLGSTNEYPDQVATLYRAAEEAKWKAIQYESSYGVNDSRTKGYQQEYQEKLKIANWAKDQYIQSLK